MAGIFETQTVQGSSLRGESFVQSPTERIPAAGASALIEAGAEAYGAFNVNRAEKRIEKIQDQFLDKLSSSRADTAEIEAIKSRQAAIDEANPAETAAFQAAEKRIKNLQEAISNRRINPTEAMARIEAEKRRALSHAPMFASEIRNLTGSRGEVFDAETTQLIKETNKIRESVIAAGGNPDNPTHIEMVRQKQAADFEMEFLASQGKLEGLRADRVLTGQLLNTLSFQEAIINDQIESLGGVGALPQGDIQEAVTQLESFRNGGEVSIVRQMIDSMPGLDYGLIAQHSPETIKRAEDLVRGQAEVLIKKIDGSIPRQITDNLLSNSKNQAMLDLQAKDPVAAQLLFIAGQLPAGSAGQFAVTETAGALVSKYAKDLYNGSFDSTTKAAIEADGGDPVKTQRAIANNLKELRTWLKQNKDKADPRFVDNYSKLIMNQMDAMTLRPTEYTPALFDGLLDDMASPEINEIISKLDPTVLPQFVEKAGRAVKTYVSERMVPDMSKELNREIYLAGADGKVPVSSVVTATVSNGNLRFIPNQGLKSNIDQMRALQTASELNKMYSTRIQSVGRALKQTQLIDEANLDAFIIGTFQEPLSAVGEPVKTGPDTVKDIKGSKTVIGGLKDIKEAVFNPQETLDKIVADLKGSTEVQEVLSKLPPSLRKLIEGEDGQ